MCCCIETIRQPKLVKARKDHRDNNMDFIMESMYWLKRSGKLSFSEWRAIAESIRDKWLIKKGEIHEMSVHKHDGDVYTFRSKKILNALCIRLDLYGDDC